MRSALLLVLLLAAVTTVTACASPDTTGNHQPQPASAEAEAGSDDQPPAAGAMTCTPPEEADAWLCADGSDPDPQAAAAAERANQERLANLPPDYYEELERQDAERLRQFAAEHPDASSDTDDPAASGDLPTGQGALLIRTDFAHPEQWQTLLTQTSTPTPDGVVANLLTVDHPRWQSASPADLAAAAPGELLILADTVALSSPDLPVLVLSTQDEQLEQLRVAASALASVENNLTLANMDWRDFTEATDPDGVFRGFGHNAAG